MNQVYGTATLIVFGFIYSLYLFKTIKNANKKIAQYFNLDVETFLLVNQDYWRGARALLFFKSLSEANIKTIGNDLVALIEKEQACKELKILDMPFQIAGFAILGILLEKILDKLDQSALIFSVSIAILVILFILVHAYIVLTFRTEKSKTNDLLLFTSWYNSFGNTLFSSDK